MKLGRWFSMVAVIASPAAASSLEKAMQDEPEVVLRSNKNLFEIERCIVMADMPDAPTVYRTPDRPTESLIFYPKLMGRGQGVVKLEAKEGAVSITVWHSNGKRMTENITTCT